ncbi:MAG: hypothetical protein QM780_01000 [Hyphomicrobium sp.]|uniref:hypothetical protein n=1 Tax=Hyphomicrobium sp. TaxID=82 RepID=UPI0039E4BA0A
MTFCLPADLQARSVLLVGQTEPGLADEFERRGAGKVIVCPIEPGALSADIYTREALTAHLARYGVSGDKLDIVVLTSLPTNHEMVRRYLGLWKHFLQDGGVLLFDMQFHDSEIDDVFGSGLGPSVDMPSKSMVVDDWLADYAVRDLSPSARPGPPARVLQCAPRKPILLLVRGSPMAGKTTLSRELGKMAGQVLSLDKLIRALVRGAGPSSAAAEFFRRQPSVREAIESLNNETGKILEDFIDVVVDRIRLAERCVVVEGYALNDAVVSGLRARLGGLAVIWELNRTC